MLKFLCNDCGSDFKSDRKPDARKCPECGASASEHTLMSLSEPEDQLTVRGQISQWDA